MLPSVPKTSGRLSEVLKSALGAVSDDVNPLAFPKRLSYLIILVDGLGVQNIVSNSAYGRNLAAKLSSSRKIFAGFPTTTATSLASLATGEPNGTHGFLGYRVYQKQTGKNINFLNDLGDRFHPRTFQSLETISERAISRGIECHTIGLAEYEKSGFTQATVPGAKYHVAKSLQDRFNIAYSLLKSPGRLVYLYIPELDQAAHAYGTFSNKWLERLEELDSEISKLPSSLPRNSGAVLTADHGVIDVPNSKHVFLNEFPSMSDAIAVGGDPRVPFLYFSEVDLKAKKIALETDLSHTAYVCDLPDLISKGWLAPLSSTAEAVAPDFVLIPKSDHVFFDRRFAKAKSLRMIGHHGGISKAEWEIPLMIF